MRVWRLNHPHASLFEIASNFSAAYSGLLLHGREAQIRYMAKYFHDLVIDTRVFCMCKRWNSMSMWAKYAGDHTGYCLEFRNEGVFTQWARQVEYCDEVTIDVTDPAAAESNFLWQKRRDWSNEEEVRIVASRATPAKVPFEPSLLSTTLSSS